MGKYQNIVKIQNACEARSIVCRGKISNNSAFALNHLSQVRCRLHKSSAAPPLFKDDKLLTECE
jgi:hypothetical protein